jgi:two-component system sensor histidine kinase DegS
MRSQIEKLQAEEAVLKRLTSVLQNTREELEAEPEPSQTPEGEAPFDAKAMLIHIIDAQEEERERLARSMHDGPAHSLTNFILQAEICQRLFDRDPDKAKLELVKLKDAANAAFKRVRSFIFDLRPMMLTDLGLVPTVRRYLDAFQEKTSIQAELVVTGRDERRLEGYREVLMFRGIQELIANARDHGGATSVRVSLEMGGDLIRAVVEDNGTGFGTGKLDLDASSSKALGLSTLQQRIQLVGGRLHIDTVAGRGAKIEVSIPAGPEPTEQRQGQEAGA